MLILHGIMSFFTKLNIFVAAPFCDNKANDIIQIQYNTHSASSIRLTRRSRGSEEPSVFAGTSLSRSGAFPPGLAVVFPLVFFVLINLF